MATYERTAQREAAEDGETQQEIVDAELAGALATKRTDVGSTCCF